jgi:hypothetical protein
MQRLIDNDYLSAAAALEQLQVTGGHVDMEDIKVDDNMLCPTSVDKKICPTRLFIREMYYPDYVLTDEELQAQAEFERQNDGRGSEKWMHLRLWEHDRAAEKIGCAGPVNETCPSRIVQAENKTRSLAARALRAVGIKF